MRVFGCWAFVHVSKDERSKLDNEAKSCIFLEYGHEEFGYRLWDLVNMKIVKNRDVVFLEDQLGDDADKVENASSFVEILVSLNPIAPPVVNIDHGGGMQEDDRDIVDDEAPLADVVVPLIDDVELVEQAPPPLPVEHPLRRSIREHQPLSRYNSREYVKLTDDG